MSARAYRVAHRLACAAPCALALLAGGAGTSRAAEAREGPRVGPIVLAEAEFERRRPGQPREEARKPPAGNPGAVPPPQAADFPRDELPLPDRWRIVEALGIQSRAWDPYSQNTLKGDRPIAPEWLGPDWFLALSLVSDTVVEPRSFPLPVGVQTTDRAGSLDVFGEANSFLFAQNVVTSLSLIKGSTAFKPPEIELRLTPVFNYNYAKVEERRILYVKPSRGTERGDWFVGLQEAFVDYHIRNVSDRYDFDSVRVGIQPFSTDFRGFLFQDNQLGVRFFGNRDNNRWQYNLAWFWRLEKDTNSGLNDVGVRPRDDHLFLANLYRQDLVVPGLTGQLTVVYNMNREEGDTHTDKNGFPVRPALVGDNRSRDYDVVYYGLNADGHVGRLNLTGSAYYAIGQDRNSPFTGRTAHIEGYFAALEPSYDYNWMRFRLSGVYASGDDDIRDDAERGFDAIFENPLVAGADTSFWIRQSVPFIGGGRAVGVNGRNGLLPSLRSSKEEGQSNFNNPGLLLLGAGADFDVTPALRLSLNANHLWFDETAPLEDLRQQADIASDIGWDLSAAATYRPGFIQNVVLRLSGAALAPGDGFSALYENSERDDLYYSVLFNAVLTY